MTAEAAIPHAPAARQVADRAARAFDLVSGWFSSPPMAELLAGDIAAGDDPRSAWLHLDEDLPEWLDALLREAGSTERAVRSRPGRFGREMSA